MDISICIFTKMQPHKSTNIDVHTVDKEFSFSSKRK